MGDYHTVLIVLLAWIPVCASSFAVMRPVRALTIACLGGWLVLPVFKIPVEGFWDLDKVVATNAGIALGTVLFCSRQLRGFRVTAADFILVLIICQFHHQNVLPR